MEEFYATTVSGGVYHVSCANKVLVAKKIYHYGGISESFPVGTELENGPLLGITKQRGIVRYSPQYSGGKRCTAWSTNTGYWGGHTSPIQGLFLTRDEAHAGHSHDSSPWDWLYLESSLNVIEAISEDHPYFVVDEPVRAMAEIVSRLFPVVDQS